MLHALPGFRKEDTRSGNESAALLSAKMNSEGGLQVDSLKAEKTDTKRKHVQMEFGSQQLL